MRHSAQFADIGELRVVALHARPPWSNERTAQRNAVIVAGVRATSAHPRSLIVGDFNATPWSPIIIDVGRGRLRRVQCGAPWAVTWGGNLPFHRLVIDHALVTRGLAVADCRPGAGYWLRSSPADRRCDHLELTGRESSRSVITPSAGSLSSARRALCDGPHLIVIERCALPAPEDN